MKQLLLFTSAFIFSVALHAQTGNAQLNTGQQKNFYEIRDKFLSYYEKHETTSAGEEKDGDLDKFRRWQYLLEQRTYPTGIMPEPTITWTEWDKYMKAHPEAGVVRSANWLPVGTASVPSGGGGAGRINVVRFQPGNSNIIYVGTAGGGIWKTTNGGTTWSCTTDAIPVLSIADIAIDATNTNNIFVATGDGYGYEFGDDNDFWGGLYTAGVIKSTDGGATWTTTGLSFSQSANNIVQRLVIHPANPNILIAATRTGIFRSTDGGANWTNVNSTQCYDIEFNTSNPNIVYTGGDGDIFKSTDAGATWTIINNNLCGTGRISIETSAANSQVIYALCENGTLTKSSDGGATWVNKTSPYSTASMYGYYDLVLECSDVNSDYLLAGGMEVAKSTNGGTSWTVASNWVYGSGNYCHADNHDLDFLPGSNTTYFSANDGGLFKSTNSGSTWTDLSNGMAISQIYRIATGATDPNIIYSGWQDNGSNRWNGNNQTWAQVTGADGMDCMLDYTTTQTAYVSSQYGALERTTNGGSSFTSVAPSSGAWITPFVMHPTNHLIIYAAYASIYKSTNQGTSWTNIGSNLLNTGSQLTAIAVAPSNANYIYVSDVTQIKMTSTGASPWTTITGTLPVSSAGIENITVSNTDPTHVWVCMSGYSAGNKVFESTNAGSTWTNYSGTLPNLPVNTIVYQNNSPDRLYVGTDIGVYYRDDNTGDWVYYNDGLPNVMVDELEINYTSNKLVAATYGRGIWQSDLATTVVVPTISTNTISTSPLCPNLVFNAGYTAAGTFNTGNIFTAQLSSVTGSFASPVNIGSVTSTSSGNISCTIPASTAAGTAYRIRVVSSNPVVTGTNNGANLTVTCPVPTGNATTNISAASATLSWSANSCAIAYRVHYKPTSGGAYITSLVGTTTKTITGLLPNTQYKWSVQTKCNSGPNVFSAYTGNTLFTTPSVKTAADEMTSAVEIYPNPSNGVFTLKITGAVSSVEIFNVLGMKIWNSADALTDQLLQINLSNQPRGMYFVKVKTENGFITRHITIE